MTNICPSLGETQVTSHCPIKPEDEIEKHGKPMRIATRAPANQSEHVVSLYKQVRDDEVPLDFTGDVDYMLNREKYELVISNANLDSLRESYNLNLRPWQKMVLNALSQQNNWEVLWVFDYDGNSGKTELSRYLMLKLNYQILKPAETHDMCGLIDSRCNGYAFDLPRTDYSKLNEFFSLIEDLKGKFLLSTKYKGTIKTPKSNKIVIFANQLPNLELLSMDRWQFFHTKFG